MKKLDLKWTAGFFDGEGCICISAALDNRYSCIHRMQVKIVQSKEKGKQICERLAKTFGGTVHLLPKKENHSQAYNWQVYTHDAVSFLKQIYPYLELKKEQAVLAIEFQKIQHSYKGKTHPSEAERIEKYSYYETAKQEMHFLNRKGV